LAPEVAIITDQTAALPIALRHTHSFVLRQQLSTGAARKEFETLRQPLTRAEVPPRSLTAPKSCTMPFGCLVSEALAKPSKCWFHHRWQNGRGVSAAPIRAEDRVHWLRAAPLPASAENGCSQGAREFAQLCAGRAQIRRRRANSDSARIRTKASHLPAKPPLRNQYADRANCRM